MSAAAPTFFFTAGEHSGDALGAALIAALRKKFPQAEFVGVGGPKMAAAGCRLIADPTGRASMLLGVVKQAFYWWKLLRRIKKEFRARRPAVHVPIDSSTINLRIAHAARAEGIPVCYYVAPQVWASRPGRIRKIRRDVNTLCCMYPFEEKYFRERGVNAVYVGHSMFDGAAPGDARPPGGGARVAVFPGSRKGEVSANLPVMVKAAREIRNRFPETEFIFAAPSEERAAQVRAGVENAAEVRVGETDAVLQWANVAMVKSGTGVLQAAKFGVPMVVVYRLAAWKVWIAKRIVTTRFIALVNILSGREVVRELVGPVKSDALAREVIELVENSAKRETMKRELAELVATLRPREGKSAAERVADEAGKLAGL